MANTKKAAGKEVATTKATKGVAAPSHSHADQLPAIVGLEQYANAGLENADRDSFAIPFLAIMQKMSPQVDRDSDAFIEGVETGDFLLTATNEVFKDEDGVDLVFCGYRRTFLRWADEKSGGGFKGEIAADEVTRLRALGEFKENEEGKLFAKNGDSIRDARIHYVLVLRPDGTATPAVISIGSTQIKKSKMLNTQIANFQATNSAGKIFNPPSFGHIFHAETVAESNDKGSWRGWKFTRSGYVTDPNLFDAAVKFHENVKSESVKVDYNQMEPGSSSTSREDDDSI